MMGWRNANVWNVQGWSVWRVANGGLYHDHSHDRIFYMRIIGHQGRNEASSEPTRNEASSEPIRNEASSELIRNKAIVSRIYPKESQ